ncbi:MAG: response regulator transcription factor, partial [Cyanobacteria bacterium]|nr:response regulator transcription factor [Cyanobacteriota bacterium]
SKILIIEDDEALAGSIADVLKREHHVVETVHDGREGLDRLLHYSSDLAIVDWNLPNVSGPEICRGYRGKGGRAPLLMLTARNKPEETEAGLDAGADDYLTKPFEPRVLAARVRALLRRPQTYISEDLSYGNIVLKTGSLTVEIAGSSQESLLPREAALLELLLKHPDQVLSTTTILDAVWPSESDSGVEALRTCMKRLRKKIENPACDCAIGSVYGVGYRLTKR